jgi:enolase
MKIRKITGREIFDSRKTPTIECIIELDEGFKVSASVPSGASVGQHAVLELRDEDPRRFNGKGVLNAIKNLEQKIAPILVGRTPDLKLMDQEMIDLDGTANKSNLGANAILSASMAIAKAQAFVLDVELYEFIHQTYQVGEKSLPHCMVNILNGGMHADNGIAFQEFMIMPTGEISMEDMMTKVSTVFENLGRLLKEAGYEIMLGAEGGVAPNLAEEGLDKEKKALDFLIKAIEISELDTSEIGICLDIAASRFYDNASKKYVLYDKSLSAAELIDIYQEFCQNYPILSIEDGMGEDDWDGWKLMTDQLGDKIQIVGDDLFVTQKSRIQKGISSGVANASLIKLNQVGTVSETVEAIKLCKSTNYKTIVSHRSGETMDTFISDFAVGVGADQFKAGAFIQNERVEKYNRLFVIEDTISME